MLRLVNNFGLYNLKYLWIINSNSVNLRFMYYLTFVYLFSYLYWKEDEEDENNMIKFFFFFFFFYVEKKLWVIPCRRDL